MFEDGSSNAYDEKQEEDDKKLLTRSGFSKLNNSFNCVCMWVVHAATVVKNI